MEIDDLLRSTLIVLTSVGYWNVPAVNLILRNILFITTFSTIKTRSPIMKYFNRHGMRADVETLEILDKTPDRPKNLYF